MSKTTHNGVLSPAKKVILASVAPIALALLIALLSLMVLQVPSRPADAQTETLPDLGMLHPKGLTIENTSDGRKLLRFASIIVNVGAGPFEVHGQRPDTNTTEMTTTQRIYDDAGGHRDVPTDAVIFWGGDGHNHWHVKDLLDFELERLDNGTKVGNFAKQGFCFYDNYLYGSSNPAFYTPRTTPTTPRACGGGLSATQTTMGLSVGWGDRYAPALVGQYIDITGLTAGRYRLKGTADANNWFTESDDPPLGSNTNNVSWVDIQLTKKGTVFVVERGPSTPQPAATAP